MSFFGFGPDVNFISKGTIFLQQQQPQSEAWEEVLLVVARILEKFVNQMGKEVLAFLW